MTGRRKMRLALAVALVISVELVLVRVGEAVRATRLDLQGHVLDEFR